MRKDDVQAGQVDVLLVEDSPSVQAALKDLFGTIGGFFVAGTANGETEATDWLHHHRRAWGLAVLDLMLHEGSGFNLIHRCRSEHPAGRVVVFSEFATPALKTRCIDLGADAVFRKSELPLFIGYLERFGKAGLAEAAAS
ncbi:MAG: putative response regulator, CheY [Ramlibacter sp.]|nr:putative response regulator, CheY [Ramlibacter sp.]